MSKQALKQLWSNSRIGNARKKWWYEHDGKFYLGIDLISHFVRQMRDEYETERTQLYTRIAELEKELTSDK